MSGGSAGTNFLCPNWPCRAYSSEMQQVIKIYGQIDVHETATKLNADYLKQGLFFIVYFLQSKRKRKHIHCSNY
jgi:hypothetical protein